MAKNNQNHYYLLSIALFIVKNDLKIVPFKCILIHFFIPHRS